MKVLKIAGIFLLAVSLLVGALFWVAASQGALDRIAKEALGRFVPDLHYRSLKGDIFHGIGIEGIDYGGKLKGDLYLRADLGALKEGRLVIEEANLSDLWIDEEFLKSLLKGSDTNESREKKSAVPALKLVEIRSLHISLKDLRWEKYRLRGLRLDLYDLKSDLKKRLTARFSLSAQSNVADMKIEGRANLPRYDAKAHLVAKREYLDDTIEPYRIALKENLSLHLDLEGDDRILHTDTRIDPFSFGYERLAFRTKRVHSLADYALDSHDLNATLALDLTGDPADMRTSCEVSLDLDDPEKSLALRLDSDVAAHRTYLEALLKDRNLSVDPERVPRLKLALRGTMRTMHADVSIPNTSVTIDGIALRLEPTSLRADLLPLNGDFNATFLGSLVSDPAQIKLAGEAEANLKDLNRTLRYDLVSNLIARKKRIVREKFDLQIEEESRLDANLSGTLKEAVANLSLYAKAKLDGKRLFAKIPAARFSFRPASRRGKGTLDLEVDSDYLKGAGHLEAALDLDHLFRIPEHTADLKIERLLSLPDLNLTSLLPLKVVSTGGEKGLASDLISPKFNLHLQSPDLERIDYRLKTKRIDLERIYMVLPPKIKRLQIALESDGRYRIPEKALEATARIGTLQINENLFHTEPFSFGIEGENFSLERFALLGGDFSLRAQAHKKGEKIDFDLKNRAITAEGSVDLSAPRVEANAKIPSLRALFVQIDKLYPLALPKDIDGDIVFAANTHKERIDMSLTSSKITLPKGRIADLEIRARMNGDMQKGEVRLQKSRFTLEGFKPKKMNRTISLKREGVLWWEKERAEVDIDFGDTLSFKGFKRKDLIEADLLTYRLYLGYETYGHTALTTNLHLSQKGEKITATGLIKFDDTLITYQPKFLDISEDKDIVIVTKKSKEAAKKPPSHDFIDNFALDIWVRSDEEMLYKTLDGEIAFKPDIRIVKAFGEPQKLTGKIRVVEGWYDFADKRYIIEEGAIAFRGQPQVNPLLDLHVKYDEIEDVVIFIDIGGDAKRPKLTFRSKPMMPKKEIFSYLLFGMSTSQVQGAAGNASKAAEKIFSRALSKDLARELNLDRLDLQRNEEGGFDVKAGKRLNKKSILYYQNKQMRSRFIYERKMGRRWRIEIGGGEAIGKEGTGTTDVGVDLYYKRGYKKKLKK